MGHKARLAFPLPRKLSLLLVSDQCGFWKVSRGPETCWIPMGKIWGPQGLQGPLDKDIKVMSENELMRESRFVPGLIHAVLQFPCVVLEHPLG